MGENGTASLKVSKICTKSSFHNVMCPKIEDKMANYEDADQIAPPEVVE